MTNNTQQTAVAEIPAYLTRYAADIDRWHTEALAVRTGR